MPINRKEFESGQIDPSFVVMDFLSYHSDEAYSIVELVEETSESLEVSEEQMQDILRSLEMRGRVEAKTVNGMIYYIYRKPRLGFRV